MGLSKEEGSAALAWGGGVGRGQGGCVATLPALTCKMNECLGAQ